MEREIESARARTCKRRAGILLRNHAQAAPQEHFPGIAALHASTNTRCEISSLLAPPELDRANPPHRPVRGEKSERGRERDERDERDEREREERGRK